MIIYKKQQLKLETTHQLKIKDSTCPSPRGKKAYNNVKHAVYMIRVGGKKVGGGDSCVQIYDTRLRVQFH
jgi:hypothetical protein